MHMKTEILCPICEVPMKLDGKFLECDECGRTLEVPKLEITLDGQRNFVLTKVFNGVLLRSEDKEEFGICMRGSGFEFSYAGKWYEAKGGVLRMISR